MDVVWEIALFVAGGFGGCAVAILVLRMRHAEELSLVQERLSRLESALRPSIQRAQGERLASGSIDTRIDPERAQRVPTATVATLDRPVDPWPRTLVGQEPPLVAPPIPGLTPEEREREALVSAAFPEAEDTLPPPVRGTPLRPPSRVPSRAPPPAELPAVQPTPISGPGSEIHGTRFFLRPSPLSPPPDELESNPWVVRTGTDPAIGADLIPAATTPAEPEPKTTRTVSSPETVPAADGLATED